MINTKTMRGLTPFPSPPSLNHQRFKPFILIFFLLLVIYWGSFDTGWQMDDRPNIIDNPGLRIENLMPESLWGTFFANQGKTQALFRPLPCLTFALNWYAGKENPFGYHVVNLGFHIATAWALYLLIIDLLAVSMNARFQGGTAAENIALLATILWAVNPIQTQAVTYIVQRMAIMAALFYVLGMAFYVKARMAGTIRRQWAYGIACLICFICGVGSKENAVLLPVSLFLVEWIFFRHGSLAFFSRPKALVVGTVLAVGAILTAYFTIGKPIQHIFAGYGDRPFTMMERVMTEPRIVLGYLSQIFYPIPDRLSIAHDVALSISFFKPWTTLPALAMVLGLIVGAMAIAKRFPLLSFAVLFYFLNHVVESTVLPLELVFEHRNYLPSLFLFLPFAAGFHTILTRWHRRSNILHALAVVIMIVIILELGWFTHTRNKAWATSVSLWQDAAVKAPGSVRPLVNLGIQLAWRDHPTPANYRHALVLFQRSLTLSGNRVKEKAEILGNIASVYFNQGKSEEAIGIYHQSLTVDPEFHKNRSDLTKTLIVAGHFEEAQQQARSLIAARPNSPEYLNLLGFILLWQNQPEKALAYFQAAMGKGQAQGNLLLNLGVAITRCGYWDRGLWFLRQVIQNTHSDPIPVFAIIENRLRAGDHEGANQYAKKLAEVLPVPAIAEALNSSPGNYRLVPISVDMIRPVLGGAMATALEQYDKHCESNG